MSSELELKHVSANGIRFAYHEAGAGNGPLVLCLHGFPDTAQSYAQLLPALAAAGYRAVAPYMRGYAPTGLAPDGDYSAPALGRDVLALIEALGAKNADVIGHDWGAYAAYCAANLDAARIRRLVLMSVPHIGGAVQSLKQLRRSWYIWFFQLSGLPERRVARDNYAFIDRLYRAWSPAWRVTEADLRPVKQAHRRTARPHARRRPVARRPRLPGAGRPRNLRRHHRRPPLAHGRRSAATRHPLHTAGRALNRGLADLRKHGIYPCFLSRPAPGKRGSPASPRRAPRGAGNARRRAAAGIRTAR